MTRRRLDAELVRRGLARSREHAQELIAGGHVSVGGSVASKAATQVEAAAAITARSASAQAADPAYASRGAHKLLGAIAAFGPLGWEIDGRQCLDAGASTGGFTDVLLRAGAAGVLAVDVGYGQLSWSLRSDPRVRVLDRTNVRHLRIEQTGEPVDVVVADLSFISLQLVLPALVALSRPDADLVLMVKPQFEVGRDRLGRGGVVRDASLRADAVLGVAECAWRLGRGGAGVVASPLPGPAGNVEYFLWLRAQAGRIERSAIAAAVAQGPTGERVES